MERPNKVISNNLKSIRLSRGLSLDQLSELTDVSKSMLRQIETGKSSPTISTIWKIANGLRISFTSLLQETGTGTEIRSFKDKDPLTEENGGYRLYPVVSFDPQIPFESYYFEIDSGVAFQGEPHTGNVFEYIFVTNGTLKVVIEEKEHTINAGEFIKFHADCNHKYISAGDDTVTAIMQLTYQN